MTPEELLKEIGVGHGHNIMIHASYRKLLHLFPKITPFEFFDTLTGIISDDGSLLLPAFTYCLKKKNGEHRKFDHTSKETATGYLSSEFLTYPLVTRTSSPTHSFALWGAITQDIHPYNSPVSPLGTGSPVEWLSDKNKSYAWLLGTNFTAFTYIHFLELFYRVPYMYHFCWGDEYLPAGVSLIDELKLTEVPGCSAGFINLENHLLEQGLIHRFEYSGTGIYYLDLDHLRRSSERFFLDNYLSLLCDNVTCKCCNSRRDFLRKDILT